MNEVSAAPNGRNSSLVLLVASALTISAVPAPGISAPRNTHLATTYTVQNCNGSGAGSLREDAGLAVSGDTIDLSHLTCETIPTRSSDGGQIVLKDVSIQGPGRDALTINGSSGTRIFFHNGTGTLTIDGVTLSGGSKMGADGDSDTGGGCLYSLGNVSILHSTVRDCEYTFVNDLSNPPGSGGAIDVKNKLALDDVVVTNNRAVSIGWLGEIGGYGGGVFARSLEIANSIISSNYAGGGGGGIYSASSADEDIAIVNSTISDNSTGGAGGGIYSYGRDVVITRSTISGNSALGGIADGGGGIYAWFCTSFCSPGDPRPSGSSVSLINSTVSGNYASGGTGGGVYNVGGLYIDNSTIVRNTSDKPGGGGAGVYYEFVDQSGTPTPPVVSNSIIAFNTSSDSLSVDIGSYHPGSLTGGNNLILTGEWTRMPNAVHGCPQLYPLGNYGGPTQTHALAPNSPTIDKGAATDEPTDQRGFARVVGAAADVGAYERQKTAPASSLKTIDASFPRCRTSAR